MPGRYKVEVQAAFKTATQDVTLEVGQVLPRPWLLITGQLTFYRGGRGSVRIASDLGIFRQLSNVALRNDRV